MKIIKRAKNGLKRLLSILGRTDMLVLPGQLAFFFVLATVPTITLIAYGASLFNVSIDFISNFPFMYEIIFCFPFFLLCKFV